MQLRVIYFLKTFNYCFYFSPVASLSVGEILQEIWVGDLDRTLHDFPSKRTLEGAVNPEPAQKHFRMLNFFAS